MIRKGEEKEETEDGVGRRREEEKKGVEGNMRREEEKEGTEGCNCIEEVVYCNTSTYTSN